MYLWATNNKRKREREREREREKGEKTHRERSAGPAAAATVSIPLKRTWKVQLRFSFSLVFLFIYFSPPHSLVHTSGWGGLVVNVQGKTVSGYDRFTALLACEFNRLPCSKAFGNGAFCFMWIERAEKHDDGDDGRYALAVWKCGR